jgi:hypothetical protein
MERVGNMQGGGEPPTVSSSASSSSDCDVRRRLGTEVSILFASQRSRRPHLDRALPLLPRGGVHLSSSAVLVESVVTLTDLRFLASRFFDAVASSSSSSSSSDIMSSKNWNNSWRDSSCRYSASLKSSSCLSNRFESVSSNLQRAATAEVSRGGRRARRLCTRSLRVRTLSSSSVSGGRYSLLRARQSTFLSLPGFVLCC